MPHSFQVLLNGAFDQHCEATFKPPKRAIASVDKRVRGSPPLTTIPLSEATYVSVTDVSAVKPPVLPPLPRANGLQLVVSVTSALSASMRNVRSTYSKPN